MSSCPRCGTVFVCANVDGQPGDVCWCTRMPVLPREKLVVQDDGSLQSCFCKACLQQIADEDGSDVKP